MNACRTCGAKILWARTAGDGRRMPVDATPVADGNVDLIDLREPGRLTAIVRPADYRWRSGTPRFVSHFATCPQAADHRRQ